jgi:hypothetical protein
VDFDGEELSQNGQEGASEDRCEGQALPVRHVPQKKPEACKNSRTLVLFKLPEQKDAPASE